MAQNSSATPNTEQDINMSAASPASKSDSSSDHEPGGIELAPAQIGGLDFSLHPLPGYVYPSSFGHEVTASLNHGVTASLNHGVPLTSTSVLSDQVNSPDLTHLSQLNASSSHSRVRDHVQRSSTPSFSSPPGSYSNLFISTRNRGRNNDEGNIAPRVRRGHRSRQGFESGGLDWLHPSKRSRATFEDEDEDESEDESEDEDEDEASLAEILEQVGAVAKLVYHSGVVDPSANDVWPNIRNAAKLPLRYHVFEIPKSWRKSSPFRAFLSSYSSTDDRPPPRKVLILKVSKQGNRINQTGVAQLGTTPGTPVFRSTWGLPSELVDIISKYLNRDDIKSLRLVNKELNHYVSKSLFETVVVPFNTEIYGMLGKEGRSDDESQELTKTGASSYAWSNRDGDNVYKGHGLDVFRGFGSHILRFGMSFEVTEEALANAPKKPTTKQRTSFWGTYDWPLEDYRRFADIAGLEKAADATPRMTIAFAELTKVNELALSVDSGLGWINGPDRSIRAHILQKPPHVFGTLKTIPDRRSQAQQELWDYIEASHKAANRDVKRATLYRLEFKHGLPDMQEAVAAAKKQPNMPFLDPHTVGYAVPYQEVARPRIGQSLNDPEALKSLVSTSTPSSGILYSSLKEPSYKQLECRLFPALLSEAQKEWLMETEWAQRAFVSSYMLSVIDNLATFCNVHTLNIARMSDRYIPLLSRPDFWKALPSLNNVTLMVIPSFRKVGKDETGDVKSTEADPQEAIDPFYHLLSEIVGTCSKITELTIGWETGGEHAEGLHARNKLILPAPLTTRADALSQDAKVLHSQLLRLNYIKKLTLKNCWVTSSALVQFMNIHDKLSLQHLVLDSFSVTGLLRVRNHHNLTPNVVPPAPVSLAAQWQVFQAISQHLSNAFWHGQLLLHMIALQAHIQQMQQQPGHGFESLLTSLKNQLHVHMHVLQLNHNLSVQNAATTQPNSQLPVAAGDANWDQAPLGGLWGQKSTFADIFSQVNLIQQQIQQQQQQQQQPGDPNPPAVFSPLTALLAKPPDGSWTEVIDIITPGPNLADFGSRFSKAVLNRQSNLQSIDFVSCGYVRLPHSRCIQHNIDANADAQANGYGSGANVSKIGQERASTLKGVMLGSRYSLLGEIVQTVPGIELLALDAGWSLETGWSDAEEARAVEFDGLSPGGTGRFTGRVRREDRIAETGEEGS